MTTSTTVRRLDEGPPGAVDGSSRTAGLVDGLRATPLFRQLVPMEAMIGWPIPARQKAAWDDRTAVYLRLLLSGFRRPPQRGKPTQLLPPFAMITLNWANGAPVEYVDLRYTRPWPMTSPPAPIGEFPHEGVRDLSTAEYLAARTRLLELYDELFEHLADGSGFPDAVEFEELLGRLLEPGMLPFYRAVAPKFVERFVGPGLSAAE